MNGYSTTWYMYMYMNRAPDVPRMYYEYCNGSIRIVREVHNNIRTYRGTVPGYPGILYPGYTGYCTRCILYFCVPEPGPAPAARARLRLQC